MSLGSRIFYNTIVQTFGKIFATLIGLVTVGLLTRYLGERGFGQYGTVIAFMGLFGVLADLGLYLYVVREISKPDTNHPEVLGNALGLRLFASAVLLLFGALLAAFLPYEPIVKNTMLVGIGAFLFVSLNQVLIGVFQKHLVQYLVVISETLGRAINLLLVLLFIRQTLSVPFLVAALAAGNAVTFLLTLWFARRYEQFAISFDFRVWKKILANSWPLVFAVVLNLLYFKTDTVILSWFKPQEAVGIYSLPYKILEGLLAFPAMFVGLVMPSLSSYAYRGWNKFQSILQQAFDTLVLMAILVVLTFWFFAQPIIDLLKGPREYFDSPELLKILILAAAIIFLGTLFGYAVVAVNRQKTMIKGYLLGAVVGLLLYFLLIPRFGYWGAAWGTVITELIVAGFAYRLVRQTSGLPLSFKIFGRALPATLLTVLFFSFVSLPWLLEIALGGVIYILTLIISRVVPPRLVREILFQK